MAVTDEVANRGEWIRYKRRADMERKRILVIDEGAGSGGMLSRWLKRPRRPEWPRISSAATA